MVMVECNNNTVDHEAFTKLLASCSLISIIQYVTINWPCTCNYTLGQEMTGKLVIICIIGN